MSSHHPTTQVHIAIKTEALESSPCLDFVRRLGVGGICLFEGVIRPEENGEIIGEMAYEHYEGMAEAEIRRLIDKAAAKWPLIAVAVEHRVGPISVQQAAVIVVVGCGHRAEAFEACRFLIDAIKQTVPIWKSSNVGPGNSEASPEKRADLLNDPPLPAAKPDN